MPIDVLCPNGHHVVCPDERRGQMVKCPKCGALARVMETGESSKIGISAAAGGNAIGSTGVEETIVFLCPNGHRLNGPKRLQGKAGQCPHCKAKFLVPILSEMAAVKELRQEDLAGESSTELRELIKDLPPDAATTFVPGVQAAGASWSAGGKTAWSTTAVHPLCRLLQMLWVEREQGAVIELHLTGGTLLTPDWFDESHSRQSHGLFAAQSADGSVTMTIVPWETVQRVVVRNVEGLPQGMFE